MPASRQPSVQKRRQPARRPPTRREAKRSTSVRARPRYRSSQANTTAGLGRRRRSRRPRLVVRLPRVNSGRIAGLALAAVLMGLLGLFFLGDEFYVDSAEIGGLKYSTREQVYQSAGVQDYSVFWVDGAAAARRIEMLPFVKHATVHPLLPNRVRIDVVEREPVAVWQADGHDFWIDSQGVTLPVSSQVDILPLLTDLDGSTVVAGAVDPHIASGVAELHRQLPDIRQFAYDRSRGLHFTMPTGTVVILGESERLAERVEHLIALQTSLAAQGRTANEINLSHDGGYTMKLTP